MTAYNVLLFVHILLFVFWLGTDLGVFLAAKRSEQGTLSPETRATVLELGMLLDRLPRSALVLILPTGLQLAAMSGLLVLGGTALAAVWGVALVWLVILWAGFLNPKTPIENRAMIFNFVMNAVLAVLVIGTGVYLLSATATPTWLALKVLLVGFVFVCGVLLDVMFKPAVETFVAIMTQGPSDELNARYAKELGPVYWAVIGIYVLVLIAAFLGVTKAL